MKRTANELQFIVWNTEEDRPATRSEIVRNVQFLLPGKMEGTVQIKYADGYVLRSPEKSKSE